MAKVGVAGNARYLAPYYPFLLPLVLTLRGNDLLIERRWWQIFAASVGVLSVLMLISSRQRPLWPAQTVISIAERKWPNNRVLRVVKNSYSFSDQYVTSFQTIAERIPKEERIIGYSAVAGYNETELWKPFGSRSVYRVVSESLSALQKKGIRYVVVDPTVVKAIGSFENWNKEYLGQRIGEAAFRPLPEAPPETIYLVKLPDGPVN
jgi:hypothetical protein